jgi:hypothetical protein
MDADDPAAIDIAAKALASRNHGMQLGYYDTKTGKFVGVDTSYNTHHLQFDWQGRIWSDEDVLGMLDTSKLDLNNVEGTEAAAQAWMRVDTQNKKVVPTTGYAVAISPIDGNVWLPVPQADGRQNKILLSIPRRTNIPSTCCLCRSAFRTASTSAGMARCGSRPAADILGALIPKPASLRPGSCRSRNSPAPARRRAAPNILISKGQPIRYPRARQKYGDRYRDDHGSMLIFDPKKETLSVFRMPYLMPFYTRGLDGRIDDANVGWEGPRPLDDVQLFAQVHGNTARLVDHVQLRPNPLAK